jgi:TolB-like protein/tetratricopeptide (TPR) repeat protein
MAVLSTLNRLRQRKIVEWALAYLAGAWLLMQLVEVLSGRWPLPLALQRGVDLLLLVGFFVALTIAWYHGEKGRQRVTGPELLILTVLLLIAGGLISLLGPVEQSPQDERDRFFETTITAGSGPGIAVLPFRNLSGDPEQDYFVFGMHEALITSLSQVGGLKVISRTSVMRYAESDLPIGEIADQLKVDSVIEGSVNTIGDQVRITVQLIDGRTDGHIWGEEYDRDLRDVLVLMSQVAESVADQVEVSLAPEDAALLRAAQPVDPELHDLVMRARFATATLTPAGVERAIDYFERAIEIDPEYALAWAGRSGIQVVSGYIGFTPALETIAAAEQSALKAIELDPTISESHTSLGWVRLIQFRWDEARDSFQRALEINPNDVNALHGFGDYLTITGSVDDGLAFVRRSTESDPFSPMWGQAVVTHYFMARRYEDAIAEADKILLTYPESPVWSAVGSAYWKLGRDADAYDSFRFAVSGRPAYLDALESGFESGGLTGAMSALAKATADRASVRDTATLQVPLWYARAGNADQTIAWLEKAYIARAPDLIYVGVRPEFEFLHDDERFLDLLARMGLRLPF